jgi:hypothetical protein
MRVAAAFLTLLLGLCTGIFPIGITLRAATLEVEPDAYPELTILNDKFPGVILSNQTLRGPGETDVLVRSGFFVGNGVSPPQNTNIASTGCCVFGRQSAPEGAPPGVNDNLINWSQFLPGLGGETNISAALRADFPVVEPVSASIVAIATDNAVFRFEAYDSSNTLLVSFQTPSFTNSERIMNIAWAGGISYILAFGVAGLDGAGPLDNLQVEFVTLPVFIDIEPKDKRNRINICDKGKGNLPVAILSYANWFDATEIDPMTVSLAGAGVRRVGKDKEKAKFDIQDANGDGLPDMIVQIASEELDLDSEDTEAVLIGGTVGGKAFKGKDAVEIQQRMCVRTLD